MAVWGNLKTGTKFRTVTIDGGQRKTSRVSQTLEVTVMTPCLPDAERAQRLARLREGEVELTDAAAALQPNHTFAVGGLTATIGNQNQI